MRPTRYLIIALFVCILPAAASADTVESSCIARISTDPSLGILNTAGEPPRAIGIAPAGAMSGGAYGEAGMPGAGRSARSAGGYGVPAATLRPAPAPNNSVLVDLINSYPVSGKAARDVFGQTLPEIDGILEINVYQTTPEVAMIGLHVIVSEEDLPPDEKDTPATVRADRFLSQTLANLDSVLQRMDQQIRDAGIDPIAQAEGQLRQAQAHVDELKSHISHLREMAGTSALSLDDVMQQQKDLERRVADMRLELEVSQEMRERISRRIAEATQQAKDSATDDQALSALQQLYDLKQEAMDRVAQSVKAGRASDLDLNKAKADVAEQLVRLAERRDQLTRSLNDGVLPSLNKRLNDTLQDNDRLQATLQASQRRLDEMKEKHLLDLSEELQTVQQKLHEAVRQAQFDTDRLMQLKTRAQSMTKPQVIVVE